MADLTNNWTLNLNLAGVVQPIKGDSTEHPGEIALSGPPSIEVTRQWHVESDNPNTPEGHPTWGLLTCEKEVEHTTLKLLNACCSGIMFNEVHVTGWTTVGEIGKEKQEVVTRFKLFKAGITKANYGGSQSLEFCFNEIEYEHHHYGQDSKEDTTKKCSHSWNLQTNKTRGVK